MTAAAAVIAARPLAHVLCCGDCAGEILRAGGVYAPVTELPMSRVCEVHPSHLPDLVATNAVIPPLGWTRPEASTDDGVSVAQDDVETLPDLSHPRTVGLRMGPLTEITMRLMVAWTTEDRRNSDEGTVALAVDTARLILKATNGA